MSYHFHRAAADDLAQAARFYRREGGAGLAARFLGEFQKIIELLQAHPDIGTPSSDGRRCFPLSVFPYSIIYRPVDSGIRVLVVRHQQRSPVFGEGRH